MEKYLENLKNIIENKLNEYLPEIFPEEIWKAVRYSVLSEGKRLRPILVLEAFKICTGKFEEALPTACALEMIHCYSLIHDDLPCMDNDNFRRGKLTNHKVFGEGMAVLAGDALLSYAPQIILQKTPSNIPKETVFNVLNEFYNAIGPMGMLGGQVVDILSENKEIDIPTFEYIHTHKTGKLFEFALKSGAMLAGASEKKLNALSEYGKILGYAFQIADDILDEISTFEKLGKTPHKDAKAKKNTHTSIFGIENSKSELLILCDKAKTILKLENIESPLLCYIAQRLTDKVKGE